jgi:hypothetical protein
LSPELSFSFRYFAMRKMHFLLWVPALVFPLVDLELWMNCSKSSLLYKPGKLSRSPSCCVVKAIRPN